MCRNIVCTPLSAGGRGVELPNFQKGVLDRTSAFRGGCWERGDMTFFRQVGGSIFTHTHTKKKPEIFNEKKV